MRALISGARAQTSTGHKVMPPVENEVMLYVEVGRVRGLLGAQVKATVGVVVCLDRSVRAAYRSVFPTAQQVSPVDAEFFDKCRSYE
jgi:hypothetical protein